MPTPLERAPEALLPGRTVWLKREDTHELGSFKWRGALPTLEEYRAGGADAVVTASTGNHGAATAWAAGHVGVRATVFVPEDASEAKVGLIRELGADLRPVGRDLDEAKTVAVEHARANGLPFFEDGAERAQYEGYRTLAAEILDQLEEPPAAVVVPVGNGALLGGIGLELCDRCPDVERIGVAAAGAPVMAESWNEGGISESTRSDTFADGLAVRVAIPIAVAVLGEVANRFVAVSERALAHAVGAFARAGIRVEGAAAAPLAALATVDELQEVHDPLVLVVTGRNIDEDLHRRAVEAPETFPA